MASGKASTDMETLMSKLHSERLIKVYVADVTQPYCVQEAVLTSISDFFVRALENEDSLGDEKGVLRFPEDDRNAWEMLLYWRIYGQLGNLTADMEAQTMLFTHCWILGHKYDIKRFQDLAMLELLNAVLQVHVPSDAVKLAFQYTPEFSPLRTLMARRTVINLCKGTIHTDDLKEFEGLSGFIVELAKAYRYKDLMGDGYYGLMTGLGDCHEWEEFMVGEGPEKHWVHII